MVLCRVEDRVNRTTPGLQKSCFEKTEFLLWLYQTVFVR